MSQSSEQSSEQSAEERELSAVERYKRAAKLRKAGPPLVVGPVPLADADTMWRGLARGGQMRFLVARASQAVRENCAKLDAGREASRLIAETLIAGLLLRSTLSPGEQLQLILHNEGPAGRIVADVWSDTGMRATVANLEIPQGMSGLGEGHLEVAKTRSGRSVYRSAVPLQGTIAETIMHYLLTSEQIVSLLRIERKVGAHGLEFAGGYLVQMMPEGTRDELAQLVENLESLPPLAAAMTGDDTDGLKWAGNLMAGFRWDQVAREGVEFRCRCSAERVLTMLATIPRHEIEELIAQREVVETKCEYCQTEYAVSHEQLQSLLAEPS